MMLYLLTNKMDLTIVTALLLAVWDAQPCCSATLWACNE